MSNSSLHTVYTDDTFSLAHSAECRLLIESDQNTYRLAIFSGERKLKLLMTWEGEVFDSHLSAILNADFAAQFLLLDDLCASLLPMELYHEKDLNSFISEMQLDHYLHELYATPLVQEELVLITGMDKTSLQKQKKMFPKAVIMPSSAGFLYSAFSVNTAEEALYLHVKNADVIFLLLRTNKPVCFNTFSCQSPDDFNYLFLYFMKEFSLDPQRLEVCFSGNITHGDAFFQRVNKYTNSVYMMDIGHLMPLNTSEKLTEAQQYTNLYGALLCVS